MVDELLVTSFLPGADPSRGAFGLLGLDTEEPSDEAVLAALRRQLHRLARHPQGSTAQADEVRLALHVAAAQLRDPRVRRELLARIGQEGNASPAVDGSRGQLVLSLIAASGGWNAKSKRLVASVLHTQGVPLSQVPSIVRDAASDWRRTAQRAAPTQTAIVEERVESPPESARTSLALTTVSAILLVSTAGLLLFVVSIQRERANSLPQDEQASAALAPTPGEVVRPELDLPRQSSEVVVDVRSGDAIVQQFDNARSLLQSDVERACLEFESAVGQLAARWADLEREYLVAANQRSIGFARDASSLGRAGCAIDPLREAAKQLLATDAPVLVSADVPRGIWGAAMLLRLERELFLPRGLAGEMSGSLDVLLPGRSDEIARGFWDGSSLALGALPERYLPGGADALRVSGMEDFWRVWTNCVRVSNAHRPTDAQRMMLDAIDHLLRGDADPSINAQAHDVLRILLEAVEWQPGAPARERLIAWLDDPGIETSDLAEVTAWIAQNRPAAQGGADLVLSATADIGSRRALRSRYAALWGLRREQEVGELSRQWIEQSRTALSQVDYDAEGPRALQEAVGLAIINTAAAYRWNGNEVEGLEALRDRAEQLRDAIALTESASVMDARLSALTDRARGEDGEWAARLIDARRSQSEAIAVMKSMTSLRGPIGPADADVVAETALFGTPNELRQLAQRVVRERAAEVEIVYALVEASDQLPRTREIHELLESVTGSSIRGPRDPLFIESAQQQLAARLLELVAASRLGQIDRLSRLLGDAYAERARMVSGDSATGGTAPARDPDSAAAREWEAWRDVASGFGGLRGAAEEIAALERRRQSRVDLARGPIQRFVAQQNSVVEIMAFVIAQENLSDAERIREILEAFAEARRESPDAFAQALAAERAVIQLWAIRFGDDVVSGGRDG